MLELRYGPGSSVLSGVIMWGEGVVAGLQRRQKSSRTIAYNGMLTLDPTSGLRAE